MVWDDQIWFWKKKKILEAVWRLRGKPDRWEKEFYYSESLGERWYFLRLVLWKQEVRGSKRFKRKLKLWLITFSYGFVIWSWERESYLRRLLFFFAWSSEWRRVSLNKIRDMWKEFVLNMWVLGQCMVWGRQGYLWLGLSYAEFELFVRQDNM